MKTLRSFVSLLALLVTLTPVVTLAKTKPKPDVLVVSDVISTDPAIQVRPEADKPIYYYVLGKLERDLGSPYGGVPSPDPEKVHAELTKAMASQGYIETKVGGPRPQIVVVMTWGQANLSTDEITETDQETGDQTTTTFAYNAREMNALVGADKAQKHLMSSSEAAELTDALNSDRLYLFVAALDADALRKKEKKLIWRTRFSIDARREDLPENLGLMFASAAPYFGRDEDRPITVNDEIRNATVKLGELKFLDDAPPAAPAKPDEKK